MAASCETIVILTTVDPDFGVMCLFAEKLSSFAASTNTKVVWRAVNGLRVHSMRYGELQEVVTGVTLDWIDPPRKLPQAESVYLGLKASCGMPALIMSPDMYENVQDIPSFLQFLDQGFEIVAGWRISRVGVSPVRRTLTSVFNFMVRSAYGLAVHDFNTCMGALSIDAVHCILNTPSGCPSPPLYVACKYRDRTAEVPIIVTEAPGRKSSYTFTLLVVLALFRIREIVMFFFWNRHSSGGGV